MVSSLLAILFLSAIIFYLSDPLLTFIGIIGWLLVLAGWRKAKNGKSGLVQSLTGGLFMMFTGICVIPEF